MDGGWLFDHYCSPERERERERVCVNTHSLRHHSCTIKPPLHHLFTTENWSPQQLFLPLTPHTIRNMHTHTLNRGLPETSKSNAWQAGPAPVTATCSPSTSAFQAPLTSPPPSTLSRAQHSAHGLVEGARGGRLDRRLLAREHRRLSLAALDSLGH